MSHVAGKVVIITDAGSGLGEAAARHLSEQGAIVALGSKQLHRIHALAHELAWDGGRVIAVEADLAEKAQLKDLVRQAAAAFGKVDVLVTCEPAMSGQGTQVSDRAQCEPACGVVQARLPAAVGAVLPIMLSQRRGHIIDLSWAPGAAQPVGAGNPSDCDSVLETLRASNIRTTTISAARSTPPHSMGQPCAASFARALAFAIGQPEGLHIDEIVIGA
jgi:NADP-dependent 3-hydroxy acid dehydrogenase YdfG